MFKLRRILPRHRPLARGFSSSNKSWVDTFDRYFNEVVLAGTIGLFGWMFYNGKLQWRIFEKKGPPMPFQRIVTKPRSNFEAKLVNAGLKWRNETDHHHNYGPRCYSYWRDHTGVQLTSLTERALMEATFQLHNMYLEGVDAVVHDDQLLRIFEIPERLWPAIRKSWQEKRPDLLGRLDFTWKDGVPKLISYNADAPEGFVESSEAQLNWKEDLFPNDHQCNFMKTAFQLGLQCALGKQGFKKAEHELGFGHTSTFSRRSEDQAQYLAKLAREVGYTCQVAAIGQLTVKHHLGDASKQGATLLFRSGEVKTMYFEMPLIKAIKHKEKVVSESNLQDINTLEPAWKLVMENKSMLALLWSMYPNHPNLLPAYLGKQVKHNVQFPKEWINKSKHSTRELTLRKPCNSVDQMKDVGLKENVIQEWVVLPYDYPKKAETRKVSTRQDVQLPITPNYFLTSTWVVNGLPSGVFFYETKTQVACKHKRAMPHITKNDGTRREWRFQQNQGQASLRQALYGSRLREDLYYGDHNLVVHDDLLSWNTPQVPSSFKSRMR